MKYVLLSLLVFLCYLIGLFLSKKYKRKVLFYKQLNLFVKEVLSQISFSKNKIEKIIDNFLEKERVSKDFYILLNSYKNYLKGECSQEKFKTDINFDFLDNQSKYDLISFFESFGGLGKDEEIASINFYKSNFESKLEEAKLEEKKYSKLYLSLFFVLGLCLFIILV